MDLYVSDGEEKPSLLAISGNIPVIDIDALDGSEEEEVEDIPTGMPNVAKSLTPRPSLPSPAQLSKPPMLPSIRTPLPSLPPQVPLLPGIPRLTPKPSRASVTPSSKKKQPKSRPRKSRRGSEDEESSFSFTASVPRASVPRGMSVSTIGDETIGTPTPRKSARARREVSYVEPATHEVASTSDGPRRSVSRGVSVALQHQSIVKQARARLRAAEVVDLSKPQAPSLDVVENIYTDDEEEEEEEEEEEAEEVAPVGVDSSGLKVIPGTGETGAGPRAGASDPWVDDEDILEWIS